MHFFRHARLRPGISPHNDVRDPAVEVILSAMVFNALADVLYNLRQTVRTNVRMCINQNVRVSPESYQLVQDLPYIAPFGGTGEQFSVAESSGSTFSITVIGVRIYDALRGQFGHVHLAALHVLTPF